MSADNSKLETILENLPKHPEGSAGVALALANAIHSLNYSIKTCADDDALDRTMDDRAQLVQALADLAAGPNQPERIPA